MYTFVYVHVYVNVCMSVYIYVCNCVHVCMCMHVHVSMCVDVSVCVCVCTIYFRHCFIPVILCNLCNLGSLNPLSGEILTLKAEHQSSSPPRGFTQSLLPLPQEE